MKKIAFFLVGVVIIIIILSFADLTRVIESIVKINPLVLASVCLLQLVTILLINIQWKLLADKIGENISLKNIFHINMVGSFIESVTPSVKAGGEASKVYMLRTKLAIPVAKASALVGLQKAISMFAFLFLNILALTWFLFSGFSSFQGSITLILLSFIFLLTISGLLAILLFYPDKFKNFLFKFPLSESSKLKINNNVTVFRDTIKTALSKKSFFIKQIILAIAMWLIFALKSYFIALALNIDISFIAITVITYITYMVAMVPLLPGGLGSFEGSFVFLMTAMGCSVDESLALALVLRFITFWFVFLISGLYLGYRLIVKWQPMVIQDKKV